MNGFMKKEFVPGKLKPEYALMNKIIHDQIGPKGNEKSPSREQIQFLYEVMTGKLIDYDLVIWCVMRDFLEFSHESRHIPFPSLVTSLMEAAGMRGAAKEKRVLPRLGPITNKTEAKSRAASTRPQPSQPSVPPPGVTSFTAPAPMSTSVASPKPGPTRLASPNRNPGNARFYFFIFSVLLSFCFQKCRDPNPRPDPNGGSEPEPGLLRRFHLS